MQQMRGVNLGGWLVLERWITPELFEGCDAKDEYGLCAWSPAVASDRLSKHRQTFITRSTIKQIADLGLNTVRLPIGYWLLAEQSPYVKGADDYAHRLFEWCEEYGVGVILDIHAAPGSQNGWDHSGQAGRIGWGTSETLQETLKFLGSIIDIYGSKKALRAIEVLNEPHWDVSLTTLLDYYQQAYELIRQRSPEVIVIMSDAFRPDKMARELQKRRFLNVMMDVHLYQLFTDQDRALDFAGHIKKTERDWAEQLRKLSKRLPIIVGEWSAAMHEMYQPIDQPEHGYTRQDYITYFQTQRRVFDEAGVSWTYWTARTSHGGPWSLLDNPEFVH